MTRRPVRFAVEQSAYFGPAGEARSMPRAAGKIYLSQPSISNAVAHLVDLALTCSPQPESDSACTPPVEPNPRVPQVADHRLAGREAISLAEFADEKFILPNLPLSDCSPGLTPAIAILASIWKTIAVDNLGRFCHQRISSEELPGVARL